MICRLITCKSAFVELMKLGELCLLFTDGDWIESKDQSDRSIRLIQTGNIGNGEFLYKNDKAKYISEDTFRRLNCTEVFPNDVLISRLPEPVGRGCIIPDIGERMITAVDCTVCRINESLIDRKYFCYFLESNAYKIQLEQHVTGTTRKRISRKNLSSVEINLPEQAKQKEIVYKLDRVKKIIQNYNRELDLLDEAVRARFVEMFGGINDSKVYSYKELNEITNIISGGTPKRDNLEYWENGTIPWVKTTELKNNIITYVEEHITQKGLSESSAKLVPQGTVLVAMYGQGKTRGMTAYLNVEASTNQACACILPSENINSIYLWKYLEFSYSKLRSLAKGAGQPNLNVNMIKEFTILVPPLNLQEEYASFVQEVDKSRLLSNHSLSLIKSITF